MEFTNALIQGDLEAVRRCPKADLHNHFVLGGSREYLREYSGKDIQPIKEPIHSMNEMHTWTSRNLGDYFETVEGRRMLIRATFSQAKKNIHRFAIYDLVVTGVSTHGGIFAFKRENLK